MLCPRWTDLINFVLLGYIWHVPHLTQYIYKYVDFMTAPFPRAEIKRNTPNTTVALCAIATEYDPRLLQRSLALVFVSKRISHPYAQFKKATGGIRLNGARRPQSYAESVNL